MKIKNFNKGLSLIEVLIVMAITGLTLLALLNLASRDLLVEKINEEQDTANFISSSQIQEFQSMKDSNPTCIKTIYTNRNTNGQSNYFICSSATFNGGIYPNVSACSPTGSDWYLLTAPAGTYVNVSYNNGTYDCTTSSSPYTADLQINYTNTDYLGITYVNMSSNVLWTGVNKISNTTSIEQLYSF